MDLIEVLWKQDVDMGFSIDPMQPEGPHETKVELKGQIDKELKLAEENIQKKKEETEKIEKVKASLLEPEKEDDPWAGLSYTVDTETETDVISDVAARSTSLYWRIFEKSHFSNSSRHFISLIRFTVRLTE